MRKRKRSFVVYAAWREDRVYTGKLKSLDNNPSNNPPTSDEQRDFGTGAQILREIGVSKIKLISNHRKKRIGLVGYGLEIVENIFLES
ncbi:MAG: hypothetical protein IPP49_09790 [Saprospiraceae bacterium]|nr:hypothetical protein [Saprospiraceae bacterium]